MILAILLFLTALASAQSEDQARALIQDIASSARATESWRAEGVEINEFAGNGIQLRDEVHFKSAVQGPSKMRWETSGDDDTLMVCDGTDHWTYYRHGASFYRNSVGVSSCEQALGDFSHLADNLIAATMTGRDRVQFAGGPRDCDLIRAEYEFPVRLGDRAEFRNSVRTLCVDAEHRLILRDSYENDGFGMHSKGTITYELYEREPGLPVDVFKFVAPTGTLQDEGPQMGGDEPILQGGIYKIGAGVSLPTLAYKVEPSYTQEARQAQVSGIVLVSLVVDPKGKPEDIRVVSGLGHGLDEKALESVGQWRFNPGMKDGGPVAVGILKAVVNFRLP